MTDEKLRDRLQRLADECQASHPAVSAQLATIQAAVTVGGPAIGAISQAILPVANMLATVCESNKIFNDIVNQDVAFCTCGGGTSTTCPFHGGIKQQQKDTNEQN